MTSIYNDAILSLDILLESSQAGSWAASQKLLDLAERLNQAAGLYSKEVFYGG